MTFFIARLAALVLLVAGVAAPAHAFVRTKTLTDPPNPFAWPNKCLEFELDEASGASVSRVGLAQAFAGAIAAWTTGQASCADLSLTTVPAEGTSRVANDHLNRVYFVRGSEWCEVIDGRRICRDENVLALTTVSSVQATGRVVDADIQINGVDHTWGDLLVDATAEQDLQSTLTHELGHALGLDHTCRTDEERVGLRLELEHHLGRTVDEAFMKSYDVDSEGRPVPLCSAANTEQLAATMTAEARRGETSLRTITSDDAAGVCSVYAAGAGRACELPVVVRNGGCSVSGRGRASAWLVLAVLALVARAPRWLSRAVGSRGATRPRA